MPSQPVPGWLFFPTFALTSLFRCAQRRRVRRRRPMLHAPTALHHNQQLLQDADRLLEAAAALLAHSRALIARGKARPMARACASGTSEVPPAREEGIMAPHSRPLRQSLPWWSWAGEARRECRRLRQRAHALHERIQQLRQSYLLVVCAWCTKRLRWQYRPDTGSLYATSHSICSPCPEHVLRELGARPAHPSPTCAHGA
jgi:hypothetical protein